MSRTHWPTEDPDREYIEGRIRFWTNRLTKRFQLTEEGREDTAQILRVHLLLRLPAFDPSRASRRTYISRLVQNRAITLAEEGRASKRDARQEAYSLDRLIDAEDPEAGTRRDLVNADDYHDRLSDRTPAEARQDLAISLSVVVARMPERLRHVGELLLQGYSVTDIADQLGVHRCTASGHVAEIKRRLRAAAFE